MKKILFILVAAFMSHVSIAQEVKITSGVSKAEYQSMDGLEKRLSDYVDGAVSSLKGLKLNGSKDYSNYQATISISKNASDKLSNFLGIGPAENVPVENAQSCTACGIAGGAICYKRIRVLLNNGQTVVVTVTLNSEGCTVLSW
ncbi:MAG TPA: hypothetical protein VK528_09440 [Flavobacterium sp.]|nr:hypothetical protein [Flavobacterium sp.]